MGWRFKKPINFGGFRLNLSKRGVGMSWGFPMFRTGVSSDGRRYIWITVPRTGLSWVKYFGNKTSSPASLPQPGPQPKLASSKGQSPMQTTPGVPSLSSPQANSPSQPTPNPPVQQGGTPWWRQKNI